MTRDEYVSEPTPYQISAIYDLLDDLNSEALEWLMWGLEGWENSTLEFWLQNRGRAEDLIRHLEDTING